jgi:hypothetical protein
MAQEKAGSHRDAPEDQPGGGAAEASRRTTDEVAYLQRRLHCDTQSEVC